MTTSTKPSTLESFRREFAISLPEPIGAVRGRARRTSSDGEWVLDLGRYTLRDGGGNTVPLRAPSSTSLRRYYWPAVAL